MFKTHAHTNKHMHTHTQTHRHTHTHTYNIFFISPYKNALTDNKNVTLLKGKHFII